MIPFGVTFYPDQWDPEHWEAALSKMKESGFNTIRFGEMAWNWVEREEGKFTFEAMDKAMDLAQKYNLKVILGIGTSQAPTWLIRKYPEVRPIDNNGILYPEYGPRPNICRDSPAFRRLAERYIKNIVKKYSKHPALLFWQIDNEPTYPPLDSTTSSDFCHCEATRKAFIEWAKEKYKTIENLNKVWGTSFWTVEFSNFEDIATPKCGMWDAGNPHIFLEWLRFKSERLHEWLLWMKRIVREYDKEHKIGTNGFIGIVTRVPNHDILADGMDWYGLDIYPAGGRLSGESLAQFADLWRGYCSGRKTEFHVTELQGGANVRWGYPDYVEGPEIRLWTHTLVAHGGKAVLYHAWRPALFGSETGGFGILASDGRRTERLDNIEIAGREIKKTEEILSSHRLIPKIAIAYLKSSEIETFQEEGEVREISGQWKRVRSDIGLMYTLHSITGAYKLIWNHYNPVDFIFERTLEVGNLPYNVIFLPNPYVLKEKHAKVLRKYVYDGGILITEARFGLKDEFAHLYEKPLSENFFDIIYDHTQIIEEKVLIPELQAAAYGFRDIIKAESGILSSFEDGYPAMVEKKIGKGKVLYATFSLFYSCLKEEKLIDFIKSYLGEGEIKVAGSKKVEVIVWGDTTPILYTINHSKEREFTEINVPPRFKNAEDILNEEKIDLKDGKISLDLPPYKVAVIHLLEK